MRGRWWVERRAGALGTVSQRLLAWRALPAAMYGLTLALVGLGLIRPAASSSDAKARNPNLISASSHTPGLDLVTGELSAGMDGLRAGRALYEKQALRLALLVGIAPPAADRNEGSLHAGGEAPSALARPEEDEVRSLPAPQLVAWTVPRQLTEPPASRPMQPTARARRLAALLELAAPASGVPALSAGSGSVRPCLFPLRRGLLGSGFGWRTDPFTGRRTFHEGQDIVAAAGTPVLAPADGQVIQAAPYGTLGKAVFLSHGEGILTRFAHLSRIVVQEGETVRSGQIIGFVGSTGRSLGSHLHYEVMVNGEKVDPRTFLPEDIGLGPWPLELQTPERPIELPSEEALLPPPVVW